MARTSPSVGHLVPNERVGVLFDLACEQWCPVPGGPDEVVKQPHVDCVPCCPPLHDDSSIPVQHARRPPCCPGLNSGSSCRAIVHLRGQAELFRCFVSVRAGGHLHFERPGIHSGATLVPVSARSRMLKAARSSLQHQRQDRLLRVQAVFGLVEDDRFGPSSTSAVISSPRWAGRQCMTRASGLAWAISAALTWNGAKIWARAAASSSWPIEAQTSV